LRDYGVAGQIGLEPTPDAYVAELVAVFREVRRVLRADGTLWLNLGDSYVSNGRYESDRSEYVGDLAKYDKRDPRVGARQNGLKPKDLIGIPWRVAFALQADGWWLRQDIIWSKPNPMPESVTDRCTKAHEYLFLLSKNARYFYNADVITEPFTGHPTGVGGSFDPKDTPKVFHDRRDRGRTVGQSEDATGRNARSVWTITPQPYKEAHFATFPPALAERCIKAGCPEGGTVLDCFGGAGTTGLVAGRLNRKVILIELNPAYVDLTRNRLWLE
jgi:DNA modification methylase